MAQQREARERFKIKYEAEKRNKKRRRAGKQPSMLIKRLFFFRSFVCGSRLSGGTKKKRPRPLFLSKDLFLPFCSFLSCPILVHMHTMVSFSASLSASLTFSSFLFSPLLLFHPLVLSLPTVFWIRAFIFAFVRGGGGCCCCYCCYWFYVLQAASIYLLVKHVDGGDDDDDARRP